MSSPAPDPPSRARLVVVLWLCGLAGVLYLDRICMGQAVQPIQDELGFTDTQMSYVMMAFTLAYGLFEVPAGWLGDRIGSRWVLTGVVLWWSAFTALTGVGTGLLTLVAIRFLFGAGEAGAFPNAARVISRWFPLGERGRVQGLMLTAAQLGSVFAPPVAAYVIAAAGWRWTFAAFGAVGIVWAVGFCLWFRDDPADHPGVNPAELAAIRGDLPPPAREHLPVPWRAVLVNRGILVLSLLMVLGAFYTYFFYSWFPKYLRAARGVENVEAGWLAALGLAGSAVGVFLGGFVADGITHRAANPVRARRYLGLVCFLAAAACMFLGVRCDDPLALAGLLAASTFAMHVTLPNWWSVALPQCGRHVATLFGLMNGLGVFGAMASQYFVGAFADWQKDRGFTGREQWDPLFDVYVGVLIAAALAWWSYRPSPLHSIGERTEWAS
jgi:MFS family permease